MGQLVRVNDPHENATWVYNYDCGGNITSKVKYAYTTGALGAAVQTIPYVYGDSNWKDKLTSYNGTAITYDAIGNPLNDGTWTYTWNAGRQLKQMSKSGTTVQFKYDHNGLRVGKVVNGTETKYVLHGKLVAHMTCGSDNLHFFYDAQSRPAKVNFNGTVYTYLHNLQGDVVGILDNADTLVVEYKYDAWGKLLSTTGSLAGTLGKRNPFRYRGYVYDEETGLYYLNSRYYNANVCRFINADKYMGNINNIFSHNVYCYCRNNSVISLDPNGYFDWKALNLYNWGKGKLLAKIFTGDKFGYTIMERWFNGLGKKLVIKDDAEWNQYLLNNKNFTDKISKHAGSSIFNGTFNFDVKNEWLGLDLSDHGEGDYWSGYGLINGSNSIYGGFCVSGTVQNIEGNRYKVTANYEFNDYIDPGSYALDWIYVVGAWFVLGACINYELQISGTVEFEFYYG